MKPNIPRALGFVPVPAQRLRSCCPSTPLRNRVAEGLRNRDETQHSQRVWFRPTGPTYTGYLICDP